MESWRTVYRNGFAPILPTAGLEYAAEILRNDDKRLLQGATTKPPGMACVEDWPCEGGCFLAMCGLGNGLETVGEVQAFFAQACFDADQLLKESAACRYFLNWADDTPRDEMRRELLMEVERTLAERKRGAA